MPFNPFSPRRKSAARVARGRALARSLPRGPGGKFLPSGGRPRSRNPWASISYKARTTDLWRVGATGRFGQVPPSAWAAPAAKPKKHKASGGKKKAAGKAAKASKPKGKRKGTRRAPAPATPSFALMKPKKRGSTMKKAANPFGRPRRSKSTGKFLPKRRNPDGKFGLRDLVKSENVVPAVSGILGAGSALGLPRMIAKMSGNHDLATGAKGFGIAAGGVVVPSLLIGLASPRLARGYFVGGLIGLGLRALLWGLKAWRGGKGRARVQARAPQGPAPVTGASPVAGVISADQLIAEESAVQMQMRGGFEGVDQSVELDGAEEYESMDGMDLSPDAIAGVDLNEGAVPAFEPMANETF